MEPRFICIVRNDLKMSKGKMVVQVGHAIQYITRKCLEDPNYLNMQWLDGLSKKIVLKANDENHLSSLKSEFESLNIPVIDVVDAGLTFFPEPTFTCIAVGPLYKEDHSPVTANLSLMY